MNEKHVRKGISFGASEDNVAAERFVKCSNREFGEKLNVFIISKLNTQAAYQGSISPICYTQRAFFGQ